MQEVVESLSKACTNFGLTISTKKTEVLYQPAPGQPYVKPVIYVDEQALEAVEHFTYLGSTLSQSANIDKEISNRIAKASASFGRLRQNVWDRKGLTHSTKVKVYRAAVLPTLLYASETWTLYRRHTQKLNHFHLGCLRRILGIRWQDKIPDTEVLERTGLSSIHTLLLKSQARWAGHVHRMSDCRIPKQLMYGELKQGKRHVGGQKKRYKDTLKASFKDLQIDIQGWEEQAADRSIWRQLINEGAQTAETNRTDEAVLKRARRKNQPQIATTAPEHTCSVCGRHFRARIGLISHMRTHK